MKKVGFIISKKENELRRALTFEDLMTIRNKKFLYFEKGYFENFGYTDLEVVNIGANILNYEDVLQKCDIIIDPKIGDSKDFELMKRKTIFGWIHATQNYDITQKIIDNKITSIAFEKMYEKDKHSFYQNNRIAGYTAIFHSMLCYGRSYKNLKAAILGNGNTAYGAAKALKQIGAITTIYTRNEEEKFKKDFINYDIIINAILWNVYRRDHIIYEKDLIKLKKDAIIVDISCDKNGAIETSVPTSIDNPVYKVNGIIHYAVDHTPTFLYKDATKSISKVIVKYIDNLVEESITLEKMFSDALIIKEGIVLDKEIITFQNR